MDKPVPGGHEVRGGRGRGGHRRGVGSVARAPRRGKGGGARQGFRKRPLGTAGPRAVLTQREANVARSIRSINRGENHMKRSLFTRARVAAFAGVVLTALAPAFAWEPNKTVEFVVPAGTGGGADQMARLIQSIVAKHKLMKQPMVVVTKS